MKIAKRVFVLAIGLAFTFGASAHMVKVESASLHDSWIQGSEPGESTDGPAAARALALCREKAKDCVVTQSLPTAISIMDFGYKNGTAIFGKNAFGISAAAVSKEAFNNCAKVAPKASCRPFGVSTSVKDGDATPEGYTQLKAEGTVNFAEYMGGIKQKMRELGVDMK